LFEIEIIMLAIFTWGMIFKKESPVIDTAKAG